MGTPRPWEKSGETILSCRRYWVPQLSQRLLLDAGLRCGQDRRMKRRHFLKSIAFTGAAGLILPRTKLFGAEAPSNKLNIALIGTWGRGEAHFGGLSTENVVALCDINEDHLNFGARKFPGAKQYVDWRKCLDQKDIEAVVCCRSEERRVG